MKRLPLVIAALVVVIALVWFESWRTARTNQAIGKWREIATRLEAENARISASVRRTDSVFSVDTVRLRSTLIRYQTRRDTILAHLTDTVHVREFVTLADSTVAACRVALSTCEQRVSARDSLIAVLGQQRTIDHNLFRAQLARANPRVVKFGEALADPTDTRTVHLRAGLEVRLVGPIRIVGAGSYLDQRLRPFVGVRVTF